VARIIWTEPALQDLERIADFISLDKPLAASRFIQRVFGRIDQLATQPKSGSMPSELKGTQYRQLVVSPVRIFYRAQNEVIYIVDVMRGEKPFRNDDLLEREMG
jgi:toxin ParE1/3/4